MNFVIIMTDTQNKAMVGAYGNAAMDTPNLDRLAAGGIRFERAYTSCPLCTPARSAIFSGMHSQVAGAWCNNTAPYAHVPLLGTIASHYGFRAAYTGKWHLDGTAYFGDGMPDGGFEPDWWYDGKRYADDLGPERFKQYTASKTPEQLRAAGFDDVTNLWGHRVADRAIDFMERVGEEPFVLVCSFDEPHGPFIAPPAYWEGYDPADLPQPANFNAPLEGKPHLQRIHREHYGEQRWEKVRADARRIIGCNRYIDREIGRVVDTIDRLHADDTVIIYTSDHGDQRGAHGLYSKGPMMYEETCNIPFIVRTPGGPAGAVSQALVSHVDIIPTLLDLSGIAPPEALHGVSLAPVLADPTASVRQTALVNFHRFAINHDDWGEFYPIRCVTDGRYKLSINLFDTDELYDLAEDPGEMTNRIDDPACAEARDRLHDALLDEMDAIRDPFRGWHWGHRPWRQVRQPFYHGGKRRNRPQGFPFQAPSLEAG